MRGFDQVPDTNSNDSAKLEELFQLFDPKSAQKSYVALRFMPYNMLPVRRHWVQIKTAKGKRTAIPKMCVSFDPDNPSVPLKGRHCPYCELDHGPEDKGYPARKEEYMLANVLVRDLQDTIRVGKMTSEERESGHKDISSKSGTPVQVFRMPMGVARRIKEMAEMNGNKAVNDKKSGIDVMVKFNPKAAAAEMYKLERGDRTPLTKSEMEYLYWNLDDADEIYDLMGRLDSKRALEEFKKLDIQGIERDDEEEEEDDEDGFSARGKKNKGKGKSKARSFDEDDDEEEEEDEDDAPRGKKKKPAKKSRFDDDEEEEEEDDEEEEEEDEPKRKSKVKPKSKPSPKKKSRFDDEEEEEEDDEEEEEEDDEPRGKSKSKAKSKVKPKSKSKSRFDDDEEEEEEDDEEEEEEEEDEPKRKPKSKVKPKSKSKSKSRFDDDEEEEEEEEDEDDEPRRPVAKKKKPVKRR